MLPYFLADLGWQLAENGKGRFGRGCSEILGRFGDI
jgi:hypothetical protein